METITCIVYPSTLDEEKNKSLLLLCSCDCNKESQLHNTRLYDLHWRVYLHLKILKSTVIFHLHLTHLLFLNFDRTVLIRTTGSSGSFIAPFSVLPFLCRIPFYPTRSTFLPWRRKQHVPLKCCSFYKTLCGSTSQMTIIKITAVKIV